MSHYQFKNKDFIDAENDTHELIQIKLTEKHKTLIRNIVDDTLLEKLSTIGKLFVVAIRIDDKELFAGLNKKNKALIAEIQEVIDNKKDLVTDDEYLILCAFTKQLYN